MTITPASVGPNIAVVSYQSHNGATMVDVNLNGTDHFFSPSQVGFVYYEGSGISGAQTFEDSTSLHSVAWGGSARTSSRLDRARTPSSAALEATRLTREAATISSWAEPGRMSSMRVPRARARSSKPAS